MDGNPSDLTGSESNHPSMPHHSPLYPELPIDYSGLRRLSIFCRANESAITEMIPKYMEYSSEDIEVFFLHAPDVEGIDEYWECGITLQVEFQGKTGAYLASQYVTDDGALGLGREIHGHPKKRADISMTETGERITGNATKNNRQLLAVEFTKEDVEFETPDLSVRFQDRRIPSAIGDGYDICQVTEMSFGGPPYSFDEDETVASDPEEIHSIELGTATVSIGTPKNSLLADLEVQEVLGGTFIVRDLTLDFVDDVHPV